MVLTTLVNILLEYTTVLTVLFLLVCFLYASVLFLFYPKSGRNPFSLRYVRPPPERLETDRKTRNSVLKQSKCSFYFSYLGKFFFFFFFFLYTAMTEIARRNDRLTLKASFRILADEILLFCFTVSGDKSHKT